MGLLRRSDCIYIAGHRGLAGSAIERRLRAEGFTQIVGRSSTELDLRDHAAVDGFVADQRPAVVILAAAKVGGIHANNTYPTEFISDNLRIQTSVLDAALKYDVSRVLFLGSSCIYPKFAEQPIREDSLLTGPLEPTNDAYAIAKIAGVMQTQAVRREYRRPWISAMPTNLYGPGDNFSGENSHVLPALMKRFHEARASGAAEVVVWGSGSPRREFLHVDDLAHACLHLLEQYDDDAPINIGTGVDVTIKELAETVADVVGFIGTLTWDTTKPDGTPRKLLDVSCIKSLGWEPTIGLREGIESTYAWYLENIA